MFRRRKDAGETEEIEEATEQRDRLLAAAGTAVLKVDALKDELLRQYARAEDQRWK